MSRILELTVSEWCSTEYSRPVWPKYIRYKAGNCVKKIINKVRAVYDIGTVYQLQLVGVWPCGRELSQHFLRFQRFM